MPQCLSESSIVVNTNPRMVACLVRLENLLGEDTRMVHHLAQIMEDMFSTCSRPRVHSGAHVNGLIRDATAIMERIGTVLRRDAQLPIHDVVQVLEEDFPAILGTMETLLHNVIIDTSPEIRLS